MGKFRSRVVLGCVVALSLTIVGCGQIANLWAKMAFREGNSSYQAQEWEAALFISAAASVSEWFRDTYQDDKYILDPRRRIAAEIG